MKTKMIAVCSALLMLTVLACVFLGLPRATAATTHPCPKGQAPCGRFFHYSPDSGYDSAIGAWCDAGPYKSDYKVYVAEGHWSTDYCADVNAIDVRAGEEVWQYKRLTFEPRQFVWTRIMDATGRHKITGYDVFGPKGLTLRED